MKYNFIFFLGCAKILHSLSPEKVPSIGTQPRIFICRNFSDERTKIRKSRVIKVFTLSSKTLNTSEKENILKYGKISKQHLLSFINKSLD